VIRKVFKIDNSKNIMDEKLILNKLNDIQVKINFISEHLSDIHLSEDDLFSLEQADEDLKKGKTKRLI